MEKVEETILVNKYQERWEARSSVRSRPRKFIDFSLKGYFFPQDKQPLLLHPGVQQLGEDAKQKILLQSFYKYLNDIINLEIKLISSTCNKILYNDLPIKYPEDVKLNACTILIDEYYHVYVAKDMLVQLGSHFPYLEKFEYPISDASYAVTEIKSLLDNKFHDIFEILAVSIFETTLVRELVEFFNTEDVHPSIKYYVNDHMNDESRHYNYFFDLLCYTWTELPSIYQSEIGKHMAKFIKLYLHIQSDKEYYHQILRHYFPEPNKAASIVEKIYKGFDITPEIPIVKNVIAVMRKVGMLNNEAVKTSFESIGWKL